MFQLCTADLALAAHAFGMKYSDAWESWLAAAQQGEALATERMSTCPSGGMCDVLDWLMGDAASSRGGTLSQDGSDAGDLDSLGLDGSSPSGGFCAGIEPRAVGPAEPVSS